MRRLVLHCGHFFFRFRNTLFPLVFAGLLVFTRPADFLGNPALDKGVMALGIVLALLGALFRLLVIGFAYIKRGGKDGKVYADDLVIQGFYAHSRNPMYVGNILIACGIGIVYGSPWVYFFVIPFCLFAYLAIVMAEEEYLKKRFGAQYADYERQVNRFIPNFHGLGKSLAGFHYDWKKVLRKEYGTTFGVLFGITLIPLWKHYCYRGFEKSGMELFLLALLLLWGLLYALVRGLKVSKRLASS